MEIVLCVLIVVFHLSLVRTQNVAKAFIGLEPNTCVIFTNGKLKCFGDNYLGALGIGDGAPHGNTIGSMGNNLPFVDVGDGFTVLHVVPGDHTCAILSNNKVKCWGSDQVGSLGLESVVPREHIGDQPGEMGDNLPFVDLGSNYQALTLDTGFFFTCALMSTMKVKCWGFNDRGQLGIDPNFDSVLGDPGEMGNNLPEVQLGSGVFVRDVSCGFHFCCALINVTNQLKCWGTDGVLGIENNEVRYQPHQMGDNLEFVNLGTSVSVKSHCCGKEHTCAITDNNMLKCFGKNDAGQLGLGDTLARGSSPGTMGDSLPYTDLGHNVNTTNIVKVACGNHHTCVLFDDGKVKCFGANSEGQLGLNTKLFKGDHPNEVNQVVIDFGSNVAIDIAAGSDHTCVLFSTNDLRCFGSGYLGQLGSENNQNIGGNSNEVLVNKPVPVNVGDLTAAPTGSPTATNVPTVEIAILIFDQNTVVIAASSLGAVFCVTGVSLCAYRRICNNQQDACDEKIMSNMGVLFQGILAFSGLVGVIVSIQLAFS